MRRIKSMKDEAAAGAWSNRLISDITALFERHEEMRKYLQPEQPPAGTPGAIGPAPLAAGKADAPAIAQQWQEAISDPKLSDIVDPGVTVYFKDLNADLKEPLSETPLSYEQDDRKKSQDHARAGQSCEGGGGIYHCGHGRAYGHSDRRSNRCAAHFGAI